MSEEKLYAVKNDEGEYWDFADQDSFFELSFVSCPTTDNEKDAKDVVHDFGGHVVTFVEEPEKVVLTKEQAEIVKRAHGDTWPAKYITDNTDDEYYSERILMKAFVNGYTVAKEKKYNVKVPHTSLYYWKKLDGGLSINDLVANDKYDALKFTEAEIEHYGLQDCEKEEVNDDGIR
ncbi:MAG: DUF1642 domain-containing protein [Lacticaseibacillus paracasei]|nr:DUF1642 domain-containing protein [Lacticaseibacillus paracasei]